jgi:hypothetical protein
MRARFLKSLNAFRVFFFLFPSVAQWFARRVNILEKMQAAEAAKEEL